MNKQFENMQKLAFGKILVETKKGPITEINLQNKIREVIQEILTEKKKKSKDTAPQDDTVDIDTLDLDIDKTEKEPEVKKDEPVAAAPTMDTGDGGDETQTDVDPLVKKIQDHLQKAYVNAQQLGDKKLTVQIGNTITQLVRTQVLGAQQQEQKPVVG